VWPAGSRQGTSCSQSWQPSQHAPHWRGL